MTALYIFKALGLLAGFIGVVILFYPSIHEGWNDHLAGQLAVLVAALCYASGTVFATQESTWTSSPLLGFLAAFYEHIDYLVIGFPY